MKYFVIVAFVVILGSLGTALFFLMKNEVKEKTRSHKMILALSLRVGLSIVLFVAILLAWKLGYIQATGIRSGQ